MSTQILPQTPSDILLWDDGIWCFAYEGHIKGRRKDAPRRIAAGSSEWYQHMMGIPSHLHPASCEPENSK